MRGVHERWFLTDQVWNWPISFLLNIAFARLGCAAGHIALLDWLGSVLAVD